jgi:methyltransferase
MMTVALVGGVIVGLMLAEQRVSSRHERALIARGAVRPAGDVYRAMAVTYPVVFLAMVGEGLWRAAVATPAVPVTTGPSWMASGVLLFAAAKGLKYWAIGALGDRWTFKVIVEPGRPLVATGPYRYVAHPNYVAILGELAGAALMTGAAIAGPAGLVVFGLLLWRRVRFEERWLAS